MKNTLVIMFSVCSILGWAQTPQVPSKMNVAGIELRITDAAKREIQADVDALTSSKKYFMKKVNRAFAYMPFVEEAFEEVGLHSDFKYLAIQESGFVSDAVSTSNAVGFWQFKKASALEVGLRVDDDIDDRKNIVAASRGAAKYIQKNNFFFNNWIIALQAYQMGAGGAMEAVGDKYNGQKSMTIDKRTYWYVKKYLAHKVAFENILNKMQSNNTATLSSYKRGAGKTLRQIGVEMNIELDSLQKYNKWLNIKRIPYDKPYVVILPKPSKGRPMVATVKTGDQIFVSDNRSIKRPVINGSSALKKVTHNGIDGVIGKGGLSVKDFIEELEISYSDFMNFNDLHLQDQIIAGQIYYLKKKRRKSKVFYHTVKSGETTWIVAQMYGIRESYLLKKNRLNKKDKLKQGRVLWMKKTRPSKVPIAFKKR